MNKRFLLQCMGLLMAVGSYALSAGDYVFTATQRLKVEGQENLVKNGNFTTLGFSDANFGWADPTGVALDAANWSVTNEGPDGQYGLKSESAAEGVGFYQAIPFEAGKTYVISFKIKGAEASTSVTTEGESNYIDVYANADGSVSKTADRFQQIAEATVITTEWSEVSFCFTDTVTGGSTGSVVISLARLATGTVVGDFQVREATEVFDTRISDRAFAYAEYLYNSGKFTSDETGFGGMIDTAKEMIAADDSQEGATNILNSFLELQEDWLNESSTNVYPYVSNYNFSTWGKINYKELSSKGDWVFEGGRWGHPNGMTWVAQDMPGVYEQTAGNAYFNVTENGSGFPAGEYMFSIDALAHKYLTKKVNGNWYGLDYSKELDSVKVYMGTDTITWQGVDTRNYNTYTVFGKLAAGETARVGICYTGYDAGVKSGGHFQIENPVFRILGHSETAIKRAQYITDCYTQQNALKQRLDSATVTLAKTVYPWGKTALQDSLTSNQPIYDVALTYIDADGKDLKNSDMPSEGWETELLKHVRYMNSAFSAFYKENLPYTTLNSYVPVVEAGLNAEANKDANAAKRSALETALASSKALIAGVTATTDSAAFADSYTTLQAAYVAFTKSAAKYGNPAEENVINPNFKTNNGQKSRVAEGWTIAGQTDNGCIQFGSDDKFENGYKAYASRGYTAYSQNRVTQTIDLTDEGYYEYRCNAYAVNTNDGRYNGMWNGLSGADSARISDIHLLFGPTETPDTLKNIVTTQTTFGSSIWVEDEVRPFSIFYNKTTSSAENYIIGLDAMQNGITMGYGCNLYGFGDNHIYYWGDKEKYLKDDAAGITGVPVDVLKAGNAAIYNLQGVKVGNSRTGLAKGLYIQNGKKFVVK